MDIQQDELLRLLIEILERHRLRYFVTGSVAAIYYGEPRFTNDIDVVVDLSKPQIKDFCAEFPTGEFYVSEEAVERAVERHGMSNVIHIRSSLKIDIMIPENSLFDHSRFQRAARVKPDDGYEAYFATAEDVIVKKMDFFREGGSEKHLRDITGIIKVSDQKLDHEYILTEMHGGAQ